MEPSRIPLSTLYTHRYTASNNAIKSTCSETILSQETGETTLQHKLSCTRKELFRVQRNSRRKTLHSGLTEGSNFT